MGKVAPAVVANEEMPMGDARQPVLRPVRLDNADCGLDLKCCRVQSWERASLGQSMVELALLFPVMLVLVIGMLDLGRALNGYVSIHNAAREGARYGSTHPADTTGISARAAEELQGTGLTISSVAVTCPSGACAHNNPIRVTVYLDYPLVTRYVFGVGALPLAASVQFVVI